MNTALVICFVLATVPGERKLVDRIVAVVNDEIITLSELDAATKPYMEPNADAQKQDATYKNVLEQLISEKLLSQQINEAKITADDEEVERAIKDILRQNNITEDELRQAVEARGMAMNQYREDLKQQLIRLKIIDLKVRSRVQISDAEVKAEFDRLNANEPREELVSLRHIFFRWGESPDPAERARVLKAARDARDRVTKGEDFAEVAKAVSQGPTAASGGDLGEVSKKGLLPELSQVVERAGVGEISEPIETKNGVHVVRVDARRLKDATPFAEARNPIYQRLYTQEVDRQMKVWVEELRADAAVDVRL
jgi:peptidyl-prolyl cis-trans isomerase SurA